MSFATQSIPDKWLPCNGGTYNVTDPEYSQLYTAIGKTFNTGGELSNQFRVPDLRGRFIRGTSTDGSSGMSPDAFGVKQNDALQEHQHSITANPNYNYLGAPVWTNIVKQGDTSTNCADGNGYAVQNSDNIALNFTGNGGNETIPYNMALQWCIKYKS